LKKVNQTEKVKKVKIKKHWRRDDTELTLLALPTFIWYILFSFLPMFGIIIAFKNYRIFPGHNFIYNLMHSDWVGFDNFKFLIKSNDLYMLLRNTIAYNIVFIILGIIIPVTLAIMISLIHSKRKSKVYQTMMFFPHFMSWVVVSYFVFAFLSMDKGVINEILRTFGKEPIQWYMESKYWPFILVFMQVWKTVGYSMVVYLASITGIDGTLYEAAVIDGANKWQQVKYITIPCLKTIVVMMFILNVGRIFYSDFGLFYQITQGIPGSLYNVASTVDTYVYKALLSSAPVGMTAAVTFFQSVACCITILLANWIVKKIDNESAII
jgi:putative aldouronate transport system permease protein